MTMLHRERDLFSEVNKKSIKLQIHCFLVPGSFDAYSTICVCHYKRISFGNIRRKLEKGISNFNVFGSALCYDL